MSDNVTHAGNNDRDAADGVRSRIEFLSRGPAEELAVGAAEMRGSDETTRKADFHAAVT